jgi:putative transcriptional regulator
MIKCNLAVLMAERGINISDLSKATGISRNALSALYNNTGKGIQFDTLSTLCEFFGVGVGDLLVNITFSAKILSAEMILPELCRFEALLIVQGQIFEATLYVEVIDLRNDEENKLEEEFDFIYWIPPELYPKLSVIPREFQNYYFANEVTPKLLEKLNIDSNSYIVDSYVGIPKF